MIDGVFEFRWQRPPECGLTWADSGSKSREMCFLKPAGPMRLEESAKTYRPLVEFPALFQNFAKICTDDRQSILSFASRFGFLGMERQGSTSAKISGETWYDWTVAVTELGRACELWGMIAREDKKALEKCLRWEAGKRSTDLSEVQGWYYKGPAFPGGGPGPSRRNGEHRPLLEVGQVKSHGLELQSDDILTPANLMLAEWINSKLNGGTSPRLVFQGRPAKHTIQIIPNTLLDAIWLQLARAICGGFSYRLCLTCGEWFAISPEEKGFRKNRVFCSDACKSRDYRNLKLKARQLKQKGKSLKGIALELGKDLDTVSRWLKEK